jgi:hypothetical protein
VTDEYIPDEGHLIWLSLDPQRGREQAGRRPFADYAEDVSPATLQQIRTLVASLLALV